MSRFDGIPGIRRGNRYIRRETLSLSFTSVLPSGWSLSRGTSGSYQDTSSSVLIVDKNVARFENLGDGEGGAILLENSSANEVRAWVSANTVYDFSIPLSSRVEVTGNIANDVAGFLSAAIIYSTGATPTTALTKQQALTNDVRHIPWVGSIWIKQAPDTTVQLTGAEYIMDLQNQIISSSIVTNAAVTNWRRFQASTMRSGSTFHEQDYLLAVNGNSGSNLYFCGKQVEKEKPYATSVIFSNANSAQRQPDFLSASSLVVPVWLRTPNQISARFKVRPEWNTNKLTQSVAGTFALGFKRTIFQWDPNYHLAMFATASEALMCFYSGTTIVVSSSHFSNHINQWLEIEISQKGNSASIQVAGAASGNGTFSGAMLGTLNIASNLYMGCYSGSTSGGLDGAIQWVRKGTI